MECTSRRSRRRLALLRVSRNRLALPHTPRSSRTALPRRRSFLQARSVAMLLVFLAHPAHLEPVVGTNFGVGILRRERKCCGPHGM